MVRILYISNFKLSSMKKIVLFFFAITLITCLYWGCVKKKDTPPALPPSETMSIDFSNFVASLKSGLVNSDTKAVENSIDPYDDQMSAYLKGIGRYEQEVNWSTLTSNIYQSVYYPNVKGSMDKQGFKTK